MGRATGVIFSGMGGSGLDKEIIASNGSVSILSFAGAYGLVRIAMIFHRDIHVLQKMKPT